jgi:sugar phosphate isomerase/epimerase
MTPTLPGPENPGDGVSRANEATPVTGTGRAERGLIRFGDARRHPENEDSSEPPRRESRVSYKPSPDRKHAVNRARSAIDAARDLGSPVVVLHPCAEFPAEQTRDRIFAARESLKELLGYAVRCGVRLALENMPSLLQMQVFDTLLDELPELGVCYDSSHANLTGRPFAVLQRYRDRIIELHISDNDGTSDQHRLPFEGSIDWDEFGLYFRNLERIEVLMLEVEVRESAFKDSQAFLSEAHARAEKLLRLSQARAGHG